MKRKNRLYSIGLMLFCQLFVYHFAQSQYVIVHEGVPVKLSQKGTLNFSNGTSFTNYSSNCSFNGTFEFSGSQDQSITGNQRLIVSNLSVNNASLLNLYLDVEVLNQLNLFQGIINLIKNNLYLSEEVQIGGNFSELAMISADSTGKLFRKIPWAGSYFFPVGDITNGADYSPVTLNFKSGTFSNSYVNLNLRNAKHPKNFSKSDYLNRYWTIWQTGITGFLCETALNYVPGDVYGNEGNIFGVYWNMANWTLLNNLSNGTIHGNVTLLSQFTGAENGQFSEGSFKSADVDIFVHENGIRLMALEDVLIRKIEIYNKAGQMVFSRSINSSESSDVSLNLNPDLYVLKIETNRNIVSNKVFIP